MKTSCVQWSKQTRPWVARSQLVKKFTSETLQQLKFKVLDHPAYSPDLAPSDFHLFGPLKETLRGRRLAEDDEVKEAVDDWLLTQPKQLWQHEKACGPLDKMRWEAGRLCRSDTSVTFHTKYIVKTIKCWYFLITLVSNMQIAPTVGIFFRRRQCFLDSIQHDVAASRSSQFSAQTDTSLFTGLERPSK
jgi:hypothetical protein